MEKFIITGGKKLKGEISVSGSKNAATKALVAACLTNEEVVLKNVPLISDFLTMVEIVKTMGASVTIADHTATIRLEKFTTYEIPWDKAVQIRTSYMFLAPLLARMGQAVVPNPGGCRIGARPIDMVVDGLKKLGITITYKSGDGYFYAKVKDNWTTGAVSYRFGKNSHTGTETLILASVLRPGKTVLENAAQEPEVDQLISLLNSMGARIKRSLRRTIEIDGVNALHGTTFNISPDRNEIVTFAIAAIMTGGDILVKDAREEDLQNFLEVLVQSKGEFEVKKDGIRFFAKKSLQPTNVSTAIHPGFMTDWQGPWVVAMTKATGVSTMHETIYENRFGYVEDLKKMGARIELFNPKVEDPAKVYNFNIADDKKEFMHAARIYGPTNLHNGVVIIPDLRAGATLVLAALAAKGTSVVFGVEHLDRGYEKFDKRLSTLGAKIKRTKV